MAKVKLTDFISDIRGSVAGTTYSKNRSGNYRKNKPHPINRNTAAQAGVRTFFGTLTKGWRSLTEAQRATWRAATLSFTKVNSLANVIQLTGAQLYIAINRNLQTISEALITIAPPKVSVPAFATFTVVPDISNPDIIVTFTAPILATDKVELYASAPLSAGKFSSAQSYKLVRVADITFGTGSNIQVDYELIYGVTWKTAGQKIFWIAKTINKATGEESTIARTTAVVQA